MKYQPTKQAALRRRVNKLLIGGIVMILIVTALNRVAVADADSGLETALRLYCQTYIHSRSGEYFSWQRSGELAAYLVVTARRYELDPLLLLAVVKTESDWRPGCTGAIGEVGLMQIHPGWWRGSWGRNAGIEIDGNIRNEETNIAVGCQILRRYNDEGSYMQMLANYNGGPARPYWPYARKVDREYREILKNFWLYFALAGMEG
ncbi:transglycosylase SLT domain-containing protein [bacterium]|nr:transglycosylase SLT domain-containing protein [bacterium]